MAASDYGLGGSLWSLVCKEHLVEKSCWYPYQLSRDGDCFPHLEDIPEVAVWNTCVPVHTYSTMVMHYLPGLSEQDGGGGEGRQVQELGPIAPGDNYVVYVRP